MSCPLLAHNVNQIFSCCVCVFVAAGLYYRQWWWYSRLTAVFSPENTLSSSASQTSSQLCFWLRQRGQAGCTQFRLPLHIELGCRKPTCFKESCSWRGSLHFRCPACLLCLAQRHHSSKDWLRRTSATQAEQQQVGRRDCDSQKSHHVFGENCRSLQAVFYTNHPKAKTSTVARYTVSVSDLNC